MSHSERTLFPLGFKDWPRGQREQWMAAEANRLLAAIRAVEPSKWAEKPQIDSEPNPRAGILEAATELKKRLDRNDRMSSRGDGDEDD